MPFSIWPIARISAAAMILMTLLQAMPIEWHLALRYERPGIAAGEIWRIVSGHFVHLGWSHLALNMAGLGLGTWLFGADRSPASWLIATLASAVACGAGLWWLSPYVAWCVGLSGVLHGLLVVGFGSWILEGERSAWGLLGVVLVKLAWERWGGDMPWAEMMAGGRVVTDAHLWGAAGGALFLAVDTFWRHSRSRV
jgi:rhomboid family GlyGly-CTERM serine protease